MQILKNKYLTTRDALNVTSTFLDLETTYIYVGSGRRRRRLEVVDINVVRAIARTTYYRYWNFVSNERRLKDEIDLWCTRRQSYEKQLTNLFIFGYNQDTEPWNKFLQSLEASNILEVFNEADMFRYSPIISSTPLSKLTGFEPIISTNEKFNKTVSILLQTASQLANYRSSLSLNVSAVNEAISILGTDGFLIMLLEAMEFSWFYAINNALLSLGLRKLKPIEAVRW